MAPDHGALAQEVSNLKEGHAELRKEFRILDSKMDSGFALLAQKIDSKTTPQWQAIGIVVTVLVFIGGIFVAGIKDAANRQEAAIEIMRREGEARIVKLWDEHNALARKYSYLDGQLHPLPAR